MEATQHRTPPPPTLTRRHAMLAGLVLIRGQAKPSEVADLAGAVGIIERGNVALAMRELRQAGHLVKRGDVYRPASASRQGVALEN